MQTAGSTIPHRNVNYVDDSEAKCIQWTYIQRRARWINAFNVYVLLAQITVYTEHNTTVTCTVFCVEIIVPLDEQVSFWYHRNCIYQLKKVKRNKTVT